MCLLFLVPLFFSKTIACLLVLVQHAVEACPLHRVGEAAVRSYVRQGGGVDAVRGPCHWAVCLHGSGQFCRRFDFVGWSVSFHLLVDHAV